MDELHSLDPKGNVIGHLFTSCHLPLQMDLSKQVGSKMQFVLLCGSNMTYTGETALETSNHTIL